MATDLAGFAEFAHARYSMDLHGLSATFVLNTPESNTVLSGTGACKVTARSFIFYLRICVVRASERFRRIVSRASQHVRSLTGGHFDNTAYALRRENNHGFVVCLSMYLQSS